MGMLQQPAHWRCFHCGAEFRKKQVKQAMLHFGVSLSSPPICKVNATYVRWMEAELARYREEGTDLHRQIRAMQGEHTQALMREEEKGYARGLKDGRELEREAAARIADDEARIREQAGRTHPEESEARDRCFAAARAAANVAKGIRAGEIVGS